MLVHHDGRDYHEAAGEAAEHARKKMNAEIERGRARAGQVIEAIQNQVIVDDVVRGSAMRFRFDGDLKLSAGDSLNVTMHDHALQQAATTAGIRWDFVTALRVKGEWGNDLLAHNLNELVQHQDRRHLVRSVGGQARGFLSDQYRRLDCQPILENLAAALSEIGAVPVDGTVLDTRMEIKAILPTIFEPVPNEPMAFGLNFSTSDFGDGAVSLRELLDRLWCTNKAITRETLRQVHLGKRLPDDVSFSDRTYRLDTAATASAVRDMVRTALSPARLGRFCDVVRRANEEEASPGRIKSFVEKWLGKGDAEAVTEAFTSADVVNLPPGQTVWRLSNAISWVAGQQTDERKKLDLMRVAGRCLPGGEEN